MVASGEALRAEAVTLWETSHAEGCAEGTLALALLRVTAKADDTDKDVEHGDSDIDDQVPISQKAGQATAVQMLQLASERGSAEAMYRLAEAYYWGALGLISDPTAAHRWCERAAKEGAGGAMPGETPGAVTRPGGGSSPFFLSVQGAP